MRITSNIMMNNYLKNLNNNLKDLYEYQQQVSSDKVINSISDDPVRFISSLQCKAKLRKNEQYQSTVESAITWLEETESSVSELNKVIKSAYETAIEVSNDHLTEEDKEAAAALIAQLRDHVVTIANSQSSDKYLFGGYNVNKKPFSVSGGVIYYNGLDLTDETNPDLIAMGTQSIKYEIGHDVTMDISITGTELLGTGNDNIYSVLDGLYNALVSDADADELSGYITKLQDVQSNVLTMQTSVGGVINRLELLQNRYEEECLTYTEKKSNIEDVDIAEAYMNYSMAQAVYNAALEVGTQIIQRSVLDYLD